MNRESDKNYMPEQCKEIHPTHTDEALFSSSPEDDTLWEGNMSRAEILSVASLLFSEQGYHGTTMRDIAKELGIYGGSIYSHVKSKEELLWDIISRQANLLLFQASCISQQLSASDRLKQLIYAHLEVVASEFHGSAVFFNCWQFLPEPLRKQIQTKRTAYEGYFEQALLAGIQEQCFQIADTQLALLFVLSSLNWTYQWLQPMKPAAFEVLAEQYATFILKALGGNF